MSYLVLARKWRPRSFDTLVGQEHVVRALTHALTTQRLHHAWLFTGTRGVGKTTLSRILAKSLNCETGITATPCGKCRACTEIDSGRFVDYLELDAASNRGVDEMTQLLEQAVYSPTVGRFKVYMIDEVHMLTGHAFNAMLKTLEEPPPHVKFILATTDPQKIPVTVLSRCLQFNLKQMPPESIVGHLGHVLAEEQIPFETPALRLIGQAARGSMRDALSLTDQAIAFSAGNLSDEAVRAMLGTIDQRHLVRLLDAVADGQAAGALAVADELATRSLSYSGALADLAVLLSQIAIAQRIPGASSPDDPLAADIARLAARLAPDAVQLFYSIAVHSRSELALAPDEYAGFVMACLRMLAFTAEAGGAAVRPVDAAAMHAPSQGTVANAAKPVESAVASVKAAEPAAELPASGGDALATTPAVTASAIAAVIAPEPNGSAVSQGEPSSAYRSPLGGTHALSDADDAKGPDSAMTSVAPATVQGTSNLPAGELVPTGTASSPGEFSLGNAAYSEGEVSPVSSASSSGELTHADTAPSSSAPRSAHASLPNEQAAASPVGQSSAWTEPDASVAANVTQSASAYAAATESRYAFEPAQSAAVTGSSAPTTEAPAGTSSLASSSDHSKTVGADDPPFEPDPRPASTFTADAPPQRVRPSLDATPAPAAPQLDAAPEAFSQPVSPAGAGFSPSDAPAPINSPRAALAAALEGKGKPPPKRVEPKPAPAPAPRQNDSSDSEPPPWLMEGLEPSFAAPPGRNGAGQESASSRASAPAAGRSQSQAASTDHRTQAPAGPRPSSGPVAERAASGAPERAAPSRSSYAAGGTLNLTESWPDLAARLPVRGVAAQLARQSELVRIDGNQLVLRVATRTLSEGQAGDRLRQVLEDHFGQAVRLTIEVGETGSDTAYAVEQSERSARQQAAEDAIMADPFVRALLDDFGGRIVPNSIRPVSTDTP